MNGKNLSKVSRIKFALFVALFALAAVVGMTLLTSIPFSQAASYANDTQTPSSLCFPGSSFLNSTGYALFPVIIHSAQFLALSKGNSYNIDPSSSFGYTCGPGIASTERVILFLQDKSAYIVTEVDVSTYKIQSMSLVNASVDSARYQNGQNSVNFGGYYAQYCHSAFFGYCTSVAGISAAYGNVQAPVAINPPNGQTAACCRFAQWTGLTNGLTGSLTQGGWAWTGFNQPALPNSNSYGFALFVEYGSGNPVYISPPSWMNGVKGQTIFLQTFADASCSQNGDDIFYQWWEVGSYVTSQVITGCIAHNSLDHAWFVFESPSKCSGAGCYDGTFQIPSFSSTSWTGNICPFTGTCRNINSYADPIQAYYIQHNSIDTATSAIQGGGNAWTESYVSSN